MRQRVNTGMDSDALQADVMRFMAIIAFCLIAVLALVQQIEPAAETPAALPVVSEPAAPKTSAPATTEKTSPQVIAERPVARRREAPPTPAEAKSAPAEETVVAEKVSPPVASEPELEIAKEVVPPLPAFEPLPVVEAPPLPTVLPNPVVEPPPVQELTAQEPAAVPPVVAESEVASTDEPEEEGLSLRFETDQAFLRLLAKGSVELYLFDQQQAWRLDSAYRFQAAAPPRQLFEMLPATIPAEIRRRSSSVGDDVELRYGLNFPPRIERQIASLAASETSGELLIDRYGRVRHVAPAG